MQKECRGRPIRLANKSDANGLKVLRLMNQGLPPTPRNDEMAQVAGPTAT